MRQEKDYTGYFVPLGVWKSLQVARLIVYAIVKHTEMVDMIYDRRILRYNLPILLRLRRIAVLRRFLETATFKRRGYGNVGLYEVRRQCVLLI